jgi:Galactose oxidase, central domain
MIVFGGANCGGVATLLQDVWVLTNANGMGGTPTWIPLNPPAPLPAGRSQHNAVYDPNANTMTIFGGCDDGIMDVPNDVWVLNNANGLGGQPQWAQLFPTGTPPAARCSAAAAYSASAVPPSSVMTIDGGLLYNVRRSKRA